MNGLRDRIVSGGRWDIGDRRVDVVLAACRRKRIVHGNTLNMLPPLARRHPGHDGGAVGERVSGHHTRLSPRNALNDNL